MGLSECAAKDKGFIAQYLARGHPYMGSLSIYSRSRLGQRVDGLPVNWLAGGLLLGLAMSPSCWRGLDLICFIFSL